MGKGVDMMVLESRLTFEDSHELAVTMPGGCSDDRIFAGDSDYRCWFRFILRSLIPDK